MLHVDNLDLLRLIEEINRLRDTIKMESLLPQDVINDDTVLDRSSDIYGSFFRMKNQKIFIVNIV